MSTHEGYVTSHEVKGSSDRSFGLVFAVFFTLVALSPLRRHEPMRLWALGAAALFAVMAFFFAVWLAPLNRLWTRFGLLLQKITNPLVMAVLFYGLVTPFALARKLMGKDTLKKRFEPQTSTYWVAYENTLPPGERMRNQF